MISHPASCANLAGTFPSLPASLNKLSPAGRELQPRTHQLRPSETLVVLTDPDFTESYQHGRQETQHITARTLICTLHQWALARVTEQALAYELDSLTGTLSCA